ncbi:Protocatechuate 3,4-dioxygenase beta subunit [Bosea sp. OK403]|uniref:dioxygenase family protein n=1 Tax=Bosea sp. OK403 TaxID=1855286 RepID=UPI0008E3C762|nr:intradiol ring-cleavage dioxygenase [Bosea sp. OK403]SFI40073.1 Protocatechuate 3,4-dioxygenase beta subunit [Bosea sp. OK403]
MISRRDLVAASLSAAGFAALALPRLAVAQEAELPLTPACGAPAAVTKRQTEGPYFVPSSPLKRDLRGDGPGDILALSGFVLTRQCRPIGGALVDLWHANGSGDYDNSGFRFRGHQFTDEQGRYQFITRIPGLYPGRTRHFHVKLRTGTGPVLTTQLYFPDEPGNARDGIYDKSLLMQIRAAEGGKLGRFDFVIAA